MKRIVSMILALLMIVSVGCFSVFAEDVTVTFLGIDGEVLSTVTAETGALLSEEQIPASDSDGVYTYVITDWTIDGQKSVDLSTYTVKEAVTFKPLTNKQYGVIYENPAPVALPKDQAADQGISILPEPVPLGGGNGFTYVYKVEGAEKAITADSAWVRLGIIENTGSQKIQDAPHWQWFDVKYTADGLPANQMTLENGYYFLYLHRNVSGANNQNKQTSLETFTIFADPAKQGGSKPKDYVSRETSNENESATLTPLAVIQDNLQPTVTFHDAEKNVIGSYQIKYTDVNEYLGYDNVETDEDDEKIKKSVQRGELMTPAEVFEQEAEAHPETFVAPTKDSDDEAYKWELIGWEDEDGNPVEVVYENIDLYPSFELVIVDPVTVTFINGDKTVLTTQIPRGKNPDYTGETPSKASDDDWSYVFHGWTQNKDNVLADSAEAAEALCEDLTTINANDDVTLYAVYEKTARVPEITFYAEDKGTVLGTVTVRDNGFEGAVPAIPDRNPARDQQYTYVPDGWADQSGNLVIDADGKLLKSVEEDISLYPHYNPVTNQYTVTFKDKEDDTTMSTSTVNYGTAATAPDTDKQDSTYYSYTFDKWVNEDGTDADFSNVTEDITVYASYKATFKNPYEDADLSRYYGKAVEYVTVNGIMNGTDATHFSPNGTATRGMIVTVLYRMEGSPNVEGMENKFTDVPEGKYYTDAVKWASNKGVVNGTSDDKFSPDNNVTREQFATMIYRYADEVKNYYMSAGNATLSIFADKNDISTYAINAVKWAIASEKDMTGQGITYYNKTALIEGVRVDENTLNMNPKGNASRAQMATMLERFITGDHLAG